jgi:iron-sulfur cluster repair protein YtfE (RIC family)
VALLCSLARGRGASWSDGLGMMEREPGDILAEQHEEVRRMFDALYGGDVAVAPELFNALGMHLAIEEAVVYPLLLESGIDAEIRESFVEHVGAKRLIRDLIDAPFADEAWWAAARVLRRQLEEHMDREESEVLPLLRRELDDAQRMALAHEIEAFMAETLEGEDTALETALSNTDARLELS